MADNFKELLKMAEAERREKAGLEPLVEEEPVVSEETPVKEAVQEQPRHVKEKKKSKAAGCAKSVFIFILLLAVCGGAAFFTLAAALDFSALNKSDAKVDVVIPQGSSTSYIAEILAENDLIDRPFIFRLYSKLTGRDGHFQAGMYSLSANMGYQKLADRIIAGNPRETVTVTIPEGYTIDQIAKVLEEKNVCTSADFYDAVINGTYDFDFFNAIPQGTTGAQYAGRIYRLEGYLFPDTYNFFTESSGKSVVEKFLTTFESKFTDEMKAAMKAKGLTVDEVVIMASITQGEAANTAEMPKVTRVLYNRLNSDYTRLECDSTYKYIKGLVPDVYDAQVGLVQAYNTYVRAGLPVGAICNPGFHALQAAVFPSEDATIAECYYFANDTAGNTYYSKTYAQHQAICRKHKIGIYG